METIENKQFTAQTVKVDGRVFKNCDFTNAVLAYYGGDVPTFENCQFGDTKLSFGGAASNTLQFLTGMRRGGFTAAVDKLLDNVRKKGKAPSGKVQI